MQHFTSLPVILIILAFCQHFFHIILLWTAPCCVICHLHHQVLSSRCFFKRPVGRILLRYFFESGIWWNVNSFGIGLTVVEKCQLLGHLFNPPTIFLFAYSFIPGGRGWLVSGGWKKLCTILCLASPEGGISKECFFSAVWVARTPCWEQKMLGLETIQPYSPSTQLGFLPFATNYHK